MLRAWTGLVGVALLFAGCSSTPGVVERSLTARPATISEFLRIGDRVRVIAHRGFSSRAPENTLAAVLGAIAEGADMVEVDVTLTADRRVVCLHDDTIDRTTNGSGPVASFRLEELQRLDAGSWFSPTFADERIPTLGQVLDAAHGRILLDIEIKPEAVTDRIEDGIAQRVVELVTARQMTDQVVISSFAPRALEQIRTVDPAIATASLVDDDLQPDIDPLDVVDRVGSRALILSRDRITPEILDRCHSHGVPVGVYTVNRERLMRRLAVMGVHSIVTDRPDRLIWVLREQLSEALSSGGYPPIEDIAASPAASDGG